MPRRPRRTLKDYLVPHAGNHYRPLLLCAGSVATILAVLVLIQGAYLLQTQVVYTKTNFLASVLPGVLAALTNEDRVREGTMPLIEDADLARAAQLKAEDMAARGYFSHVDPDGHAPWYWLQQVGYTYTYAGENLAVNFVDSTAVEEAWMQSPTHRANIVKQQYTHIGVGVARGTYNGEPSTFVVQFFATPLGETVSPAHTELARAESAPTGDSPRVLGVAVEPTTSTPLGFMARIASSPTHTLIYILGGAIVLFSLLLLGAVLVRIRVQYLEVIGGGLLILAVAAGLLVAAVQTEEPTVPATATTTETH